MKVDRENLAAVRQCFANTALSHKVQEVAAERKEKRITWFKILNIVVVGAVLTLFVTQAIFPDQHILAYVGAGLTVAEIILMISHLTFGIEQEAVAHKNSALKYMALRDRYKSFMADIIQGTLAGDELARKRDDLLREYQMISDLALQTSEDDYHKAMKKLKLVEDGQNVWSDEQVNSLLPKELRATK